jgi:hypothetical protein
MLNYFNFFHLFRFAYKGGAKLKQTLIIIMIIFRCIFINPFLILNMFGSTFISEAEKVEKGRRISLATLFLKIE